MFLIRFKINIKRKGFTLIETLIYIVLFSIISTIVLMSVSVSAKIYGTARVNNLITESGNNSMERITRNIRSASSISSNSVLGSALGVLELINTDGTSSKIYINNEAVVLNENGILSGSLTNQNLSVSSLFFYKISTPNGFAVKTEMVLGHIKTNKFEKFQTTTVLRNSY